MTKNKNAVATKKKNKTVFDVIKAGKDNFNAALPSMVDTDRFVRIALTCVRENPKLAECTQPSLLGSLMTAAQLGLEPGMLGQCYLIPYKDKKKGTVECQFQLGYQGQIELLRRTGQLNDIYPVTVYSNDKFDIELGTKKRLIHKPAYTHVGGRGEVIGFYAVAELSNGAKAFQYMTKQEVEEHEKKYRKGQWMSDPWKKNFNEMAEKTVIKKLLKYLPASVELLNKVDNTLKKNTEEVKKAEEVDDFLEVEIIEEGTTVIDETTGEIIPSSDSVTEEIVEMFGEDKK